MPAGRRSGLGALGAALAAALLLLAVACSSSNGALTLDEYIAWCVANAENNNLTDSGAITWGEATDILERGLNDARSINPPEEVRQYHDGRTAGLQALTAAAQQEESGEPFNLFTLLGAGLFLVGIIEEAEQSLSPSTRTALEEGGCLDPEVGDDTSTNNGDGQVDRSEIAAIGDRIAVERPQSEDRFEMIIRGRPRRIDDVYSVPVTVIATVDEWTYESSIWTNDQIELVSEPDENGRIYKLTEATSFWDRPDDSLDGVILVIGGQHEGALYFRAGDAPPDTQFVELRYPAGGAKRVVDLSR